MKKSSLFHIFTTAALAACAQSAGAFSPDAFAASSVLADGRWVKVSVAQSGMHCIPLDSLRAWGFVNPATIGVYGYGGRQIGNVLSQDTYTDDLPQVPARLTDAGLVFYAAGPDQWVPSVNSNYHNTYSIYSPEGYYFLSDSRPVADAMATTGRAGAAYPDTSAQARLHHEVNTTLPSKAGTLIVGEDLRRAPRQSLVFDTPGRLVIKTPGSVSRLDSLDVWFETQVVHRHLQETAALQQSVAVSSGTGQYTENISATTDSRYIHGSLLCTRHAVRPVDPSQFTLDIQYTPCVSSYDAWLDYVSVNYTRTLAMDSAGVVEFWSPAQSLAFRCPSLPLQLWDVTDPANVAAVCTDFDGTSHRWQRTAPSTRHYVAWCEEAAMPSPGFAGEVAHQNLHAQAAGADMIILVPGAYEEAAELLASWHREHDGMIVDIVQAAEVYNEFASGAPDVSAIRRYLKMRYDRSVGTAHPLQYVVLMGRPTLDHTYADKTRCQRWPTIPSWGATTPRQSLSDHEGFLTDDFIAMLGDGTGADMGLDSLAVAVGRIPATTDAGALAMVNGLIEYLDASPRGTWQNRLLIVADDEDNGVHAEQAEMMYTLMMQNTHQQHIVDKVYLDAYECHMGPRKRMKDTYPEARRALFDYLHRGSAWWIYTGHANQRSWTGDGLLTMHHFSDLHLDHKPFMMVATCDFLRWDEVECSGGEHLFGTAAAISGMVSSTRPVYTPENGNFLAALGRAILSRSAATGRRLRAGDIYRLTKNSIHNSSGLPISSVNRARLVFMGDPALPLPAPDLTVVVDSINRQPVADSRLCPVPQDKPVTISGYIAGLDGTVLSGFDGTVQLDIYGNTASKTTNGWGEGQRVPYEEMGPLLQQSAATVRSGRFEASLSLPARYDDEATGAAVIAAYAATGGSTPLQAAGVCRQLILVRPQSPSLELADTQAPVIEELEVVVNTDGTAALHARVADNTGICIAASIVGAPTAAVLDGNTTVDLANYYRPFDDGTHGGEICAPLPLPLADGRHTVTLKAYDMAGNCTRQSCDFVTGTPVPVLTLADNSAAVRGQAVFELDGYDHADTFLITDHTGATVHSAAGTAFPCRVSTAKLEPGTYTATAMVAGRHSSAALVVMP